MSAAGAVIIDAVLELTINKPALAVMCSQEKEKKLIKQKKKNSDFCFWIMERICKWVDGFFFLKCRFNIFVCTAENAICFHIFLPF